MKAQKMPISLSKSKIRLAKVGMAAVGIMFLSLYLVVDYI
jgi:hypothetical protein|tara:strand:+ start:3006 stop:3125 length:120 start_codon:yes stop_codon:yes gene_type:complete